MHSILRSHVRDASVVINPEGVTLRDVSHMGVTQALGTLRRYDA